MKNIKIVACLAILVIAVGHVSANTKPKYKLPKKNVEFEVVKKPIKKILDITPITDFYPISGTDLSVKSPIFQNVNLQFRDVKLLKVN